MTDKPVLTKEQAEALEELKIVWDDVDKKERNGILIGEKMARGEWRRDELKPADPIPDDDFIYALHYGYDVEKDKYDELREYSLSRESFIAFIHNAEDPAYQRNLGRLEGMRKTLNILGIAVDGINGGED